MLIRDFLLLLLDDALEEARLRHLANPLDRIEFQGAEHAVGECRAYLTGENLVCRMTSLLEECRAATRSALEDHYPDVMFWFAREAMVEWIASVVSVILMQQRIPVIVAPSRVAALAAARLVGADIQD
jgi:hypothetical protein